MARFFAQIFTPLFALLGIGGIFLGDATTPGKGELGSLDLDLTPARDIFDIALMALFVVVGFVASRYVGRRLMALAGLALVAFGVLGFVTGESGALGMQGSLAMNLFCVITGALALLAAAGTIEEPEAPQGSFLRGG